MATKYMIVHCKHEGCYDFHCIEDESTGTRITPITVNIPKIFLFHSKNEAHDFFEEYMNDVDVIDIRCRKGEELEHIDFCTCGIIEMDDDDNPILFYNKKNQIFLLEHTSELFLPSDSLKKDVHNINTTHKLMRKCKRLSIEQKKKYIELGKMCERNMNKVVKNENTMSVEENNDEKGKNDKI